MQVSKTSLPTKPSITTQNNKFILNQQQQYVEGHYGQFVSPVWNSFPNNDFEAIVLRQ